MINMYCENVVKVVEDQRKEVVAKLYCKNIASKLLRQNYEEMLEQYDELLVGCYQYLEEMLKEENT